jgi:hypothetical protein
LSCEVAFHRDLENADPEGNRSVSAFQKMSAMRDRTAGAKRGGNMDHFG